MLCCEFSSSFSLQILLFHVPVGSSVSLFFFSHVYGAPHSDIFSILFFCPSCFGEHIYKQELGEGGGRSLTEFSEEGFETKKKIFFFRIWTYAAHMHNKKRGSPHNPNPGAHLYATKLLHCVRIPVLPCTATVSCCRRGTTPRSFAMDVRNRK